MNIQDSVILITGSSHRVGSVIALTLARRRAKVVIHYYSEEEKAEGIAAQIRDMGAESIAVQGDISSRSDWMRMRDLTMKKWGKIDVLVNNAAIFYRTPLPEITDQDWDSFLDVNLKGTFLGCQVIGDLMLKHKSGKIINIADVSAETVWPGYIPYCVSKAGVVALTKGLAKAMAPHVTVNAIAPGTILLAENYDEDEERMLLEKTPLRRIGDPQDIANTVNFIIEGSDFITGTIIKVDGGRSLT